jgi:hypothetical protein
MLRVVLLYKYILCVYIYMSVLNVNKIDFRYRGTSGTAGDIVWDLCLKFDTGAGLIGVMPRFSAGRYRTNTHIYLYYH